MSAGVLDIAARFFSAVERGDIDEVAAIYAPGARIWHNHDRAEQSVEENLRVLRWVARNLPHRRYNVQRRVEIPGGFMQQHVLEGETPAGAFSMPACVVFQVAGGRITRLEEYLDSAQASHLTNLVEAAKATPAGSSKPSS